MTEFKPGDRVRILEARFAESFVGREAIILRKMEEGNVYAYKVRAPGMDGGDFDYEIYVNEVEAVKRGPGEFKPGDKVVVPSLMTKSSRYAYFVGEFDGTAYLTWSKGGIAYRLNAEEKAEMVAYEEPPAPFKVGDTLNWRETSYPVYHVLEIGGDGSLLVAYSTNKEDQETPGETQDELVANTRIYPNRFRYFNKVNPNA